MNCRSLQSQRNDPASLLSKGADTTRSAGNVAQSRHRIAKSARTNSRSSKPARATIRSRVNHAMPQDKQLLRVNLDEVVEKRRLDQALNAKEFAVLAGISYSTAREWFRLPGFPVFHGVVFWQDFVLWRAVQTGLNNPDGRRPFTATPAVTQAASESGKNLPPRAVTLLTEAG